MFYLDLTSFATGLVTGAAGMAIFVAFGALLVVHSASETDKRGLAARHSRREQWGSELPAAPLAAWPVLDPLTTPVDQLLAQADVLVPPYRPSGPGSSTVAAPLPSAKAPRSKRPPPESAQP